ncbi:MAG: hypothetical protein K9I74_01290 [Bacteroidales bacterium]|nr:hypothetical protein [Bacteroidales bacterium]
MDVNIFSIWVSIIGALFVIVLSIKITINSIILNYSDKSKDLKENISDIINELQKDIYSLSEQLNKESKLPNIEKTKSEFDKIYSSLLEIGNKILYEYKSLDYKTLIYRLKNDVFFYSLRTSILLLKSRYEDLQTKYTLPAINKEIENANIYEIYDDYNSNDEKLYNMTKIFVRKYTNVEKINHIEENIKDYSKLASHQSFLNKINKKVNQTILIYFISLITSILGPILYIHNEIRLSYSILLFGLIIFLLISSITWLSKYENMESKGFVVFYYISIFISIIISILFYFFHSF